MLVPLVRLLADPVEKCRDGALVFLASAAEQLPDPAALLPCLVPAVAERMGDMPVAEPSEELRLAIIRLIAGPVILRGGQDLLPYLTMIVKVVCRALEDPFHEIKKVCHYTNPDRLTLLQARSTYPHACCARSACTSDRSPSLSKLQTKDQLQYQSEQLYGLQAGCSAIASLCHVIPAEALHSQHNALLVSLLPSLGHQHSKVRTCTLTALDTLVIKVLMQKKLSIKHCTVACTDLLICKPVTSGCQPMLQKLYTVRSCRTWLTAIPCMSNPVSKTYRCIRLPQSCML